MGESGQTAWERWELASFDAPSQPQKPADQPEAGSEVADMVKLPTAAEIEQIHQQAHDEGYQRGQAEGYQAGLKEGQTKALAEAQRLASAAGKLESALAKLEETVAKDLLSLAVELAREVIRQEIAARPETLLAVVREAIGQLPHQHVAIYLNPEDASLLRSYMGDQLAHAGHRIHEDFKLARGDCVLEAGGSQLDATVSMRWQRVLDSLGLAEAWQPDAVPPAPTFERSEDKALSSATKRPGDDGSNEP
jgi:flagellar assembly protein FliH